MCEYAEYNDNGVMICKPKNEMCLFCVMGNAKQYKEIKEQDKKRGGRQ